MKKKYRIGMIVAATVFLGFAGVSVACKHVAGSENISSIKLNKTKATLSVGEKMTLKVNGISAKKAADMVRFSSSRARVVSVNKNGILTAKRKGTATITVKLRKGTASAKCKVTVKGKQAKEKEKMNVQVTIGSHNLKVKLEDNEAARTLYQKLEKGKITVKLSDYGSFEKVGDLGFSLPRSDKQMTTKPGDIVLYQGDNLVMFYGSNSWSYTKLGEFQNISVKELKNVFGSGNISVTFSI